MKQILILGGGIGGLVAANKLRKKLSKEHKIILIDKNDKHIYAPSFLWVMEGKRNAEKIQKQIILFESNPKHPSLRLHKLSGTFDHMWSLSITMSIRMVFRLMSKETAYFVDIGAHDEVYRK